MPSKKVNASVKGLLQETEIKHLAQFPAYRTLTFYICTLRAVDKGGGIHPTENKGKRSANRGSSHFGAAKAPTQPGHAQAH